MLAEVLEGMAALSFWGKLDGISIEGLKAAQKGREKHVKSRFAFMTGPLPVHNCQSDILLTRGVKGSNIKLTAFTWHARKSSN